MKKILLSLLLLSTAYSTFLYAQQATLISPVARPSETNYILQRLDCNFATNTCVIYIDIKDSSNTTIIRSLSVAIPDSNHPTATWSSILAAIGTVRSGEIGVPERKANFRIIGYLFDQGYFSGVNVTP